MCPDDPFTTPPAGLIAGLITAIRAEPRAHAAADKARTAAARSPPTRPVSAKRSHFGRSLGGTRSGKVGRMRTISVAGLCLVSAMVAVAQSPDRPSLLVHWPVDAPIIERSALDLDLAPAAAASAIGTALAAGIPHQDRTDLAVRLPLDLDADDLPAAILAADVMRSMPSGLATHIPPRRAAWPRPPHALGCPFTSPKACAMWHAGR